MLRLSQYGYNVLIACWLMPFFAWAVVGNASSEGSQSDMYAATAAVCAVLFAIAVAFAYQSKGQTASTKAAQVRAADPSDAAVVSFENLHAWKWAYCLAVGLIAVVAAITHYLVNRNAHGVYASIMLAYAGVDVFIAFISLTQFWSIKKGHIVQLSNKAADSMFEHHQ